MQETLETQVPSLEKKWQPTPVFLPGESHGQRNLQSYVHGVAKSWTQLKRLSTQKTEYGDSGCCLKIKAHLIVELLYH